MTPNRMITTISRKNPEGNWLNTLRPRQNGRHFPDDIFDCIFLNENVRISLAISLKFVPRGPIIYIPALVQIMAWRRPGDKPLSEPMMINLQTYICVTRPQWVNPSLFDDSRTRKYANILVCIANPAVTQRIGAFWRVLTCQKPSQWTNMNNNHADTSD